MDFMPCQIKSKFIRYKPLLKIDANIWIFQKFELTLSILDECAIIQEENECLFVNELSSYYEIFNKPWTLWPLFGLSFISFAFNILLSTLPDKRECQKKSFDALETIKSFISMQTWISAWCLQPTYNIIKLQRDRASIKMHYLFY